MKKVISVCLYIILFLVVTFIIVLSIKKYFDNKKHIRLNNIIATNYVVDFVSYNKIENNIVIENLQFEKEKDKTVNVKKEDEIDIKEEIDKEEEIKEEIEEEKDDVYKDAIIEEVIVDEFNNETIIEEDIIYDNLSEEELVLRLDKNLKNELSGMGIYFVEYYKKTSLDPYLSAAIVLHETGCNWNCSKLVKECYNYGGMKGGENKYKETNYTCYASKEEGLNAYLNMLYNNYYSKGLNTPELMNTKYASSLEWSVAVNKYINKFKEI